MRQTENMLVEIEAALDNPGARVLLEGPARSGKTIIAMSLLANDPSAKMLLMNWYFYDALKDAFKVWARQDEKEIARLFSPPEELMREIALHEADIVLLDACKHDPRILPALLKMWHTPQDPPSLAYWKKMDDEWVLGGCRDVLPGDIVYVWQKSKRRIQLQVVDQLLPGGLARHRRIFSSSCILAERFLGNLDEYVPGVPLKWGDVPGRLIDLQKLVESHGIAEVLAARIKAISRVLDSSEQKFFHHDRKYQDGLWIKQGRKLISDSSTLICDEAQRLGAYGNLDECAWVRGRAGRTFLCGDDNQRLNRRGDRGIASIVAGREFKEFHLPDSVGIPREIELLVKAMLGEGIAPKVQGPFAVKLIFGDDLGLVSAFEKDPSAKKHYAIPMSTGFYGRDYVPCIMRSARPTEKCSADCEGKYCAHRYIRSLSPLSDPERLPVRKDLSRSYKFFCAEAIMPNYALSAYELISREVESIYLKIPRRIGISLLRAPMDGDEITSWIKRHLYVLMTRATSSLVINIEDEQLYEFFRTTCEDAGLIVE